MMHPVGIHGQRAMSLPVHVQPHVKFTQGRHDSIVGAPSQSSSCMRTNGPVTSDYSTGNKPKLLGFFLVPVRRFGCPALPQVPPNHGSLACLFLTQQPKTTPPVSCSGNTLLLCIRSDHFFLERCNLER